jgi:hypothetical protein
VSDALEGVIPSVGPRTNRQRRLVVAGRIQALRVAFKRNGSGSGSGSDGDPPVGIQFIPVYSFSGAGEVVTDAF